MLSSPSSRTHATPTDLEGPCPTCETQARHTVTGTSPHIESGTPVPQVTCSNCGATTDITEIHARRATRSPVEAFRAWVAARLSALRGGESDA